MAAHETARVLEGRRAVAHSGRRTQTKRDRVRNRIAFGLIVAALIGLCTGAVSEAALIGAAAGSSATVGN